MSGSSRTFFFFFLSPNVKRVTCNRYVVNAIYSGAKGAHFSDNDSVWVVDCEAEINVTFKIGGQSYPVHPLDVTQEQIDPNGDSFCFGTVRMAYP